MNLEFVELELDWPAELSVFDLRNYILSKLINYGIPLRWGITSLTTSVEESMQKIYIEAIFVMNEGKKKDATSPILTKY